MQKHNLFQKAHTKILNQGLIWLLSASAIFGGGKVKAQQDNSAPINYNELIYKKADGKSYPKATDFIEWLNKSQYVDVNDTNPKLKIDSIPVSSSEEIESNTKCFYDKVKNVVIIRIPIPSDAPAYFREKQTIEYINEVCARLPMSYAHEIGHWEMSQISELGMTISEISRFTVIHEIAARVREILFIRASFLESGDIWDALSGTLIRNGDLPYVNMSTGLYNTKRTDVDFVRSDQPIRYANWLYSNKNKILKNPEISEKEASEIVLCAAQMFDKLKISSNDLKAVLEYDVRRLTGIYRLLEKNQITIQEIGEKHPNLRINNIVSFENAMEQMFVGLWQMLTDKDKQTVLKIADGSKDWKNFLKAIENKYVGFDNHALGFVGKHQEFFNKKSNQYITIQQIKGNER